ncbi:MAG: hypothetical protein II070_00970, partial [Treponema sp.]|nr:hypothetical protein [Treponema sp.]
YLFALLIFMDCRVEPGNDTMLLISGFLSMQIQSWWKKNLPCRYMKLQNLIDCILCAYHSIENIAVATFGKKVKNNLMKH